MDIASCVLKWISSNASVVAVIVAASGVVFAGLQLRQSRKATQVQVFGEIFNKLGELQNRYNEIDTSSGSADQDRWLSEFFNTLEYMAFLVNEGFVPKKSFMHFYQDAILGGYEEIFQKFATSDQKNNADRYTELKKIYKRLKSTKEKPWTSIVRKGGT